MRVLDSEDYGEGFMFRLYLDANVLVLRRKLLLEVIHDHEVPGVPVESFEASFETPLAKDPDELDALILWLEGGGVSSKNYSNRDVDMEWGYDSEIECHIRPQIGLGGTGDLSIWSHTFQFSTIEMELQGHISRLKKFLKFMIGWEHNDENIETWEQ